MRTFRPLILLPALWGVFLFSTIAPTVQAGLGSYYRYYRDAIQADLLAIPAGTPATDEQKLALSADLTRLFPYVYPLPTVTIDFLADRLAGAASAGHLAPEDAAAVAKRLVFLLEGFRGIPAEQFEAFRALLAKGGADPTEVGQILDAVQALQYSYDYDNTSVSLSNALQIINPDAAGYRHASGNASIGTYLSPIFNRDGVATDPASLRHGLNVQIDYLPIGRYRVSVTTAPNGETTELGTFRVRKNPITNGPGMILLNSGLRSGSVTFGNLAGAKPVPAGVVLDRVTGVTITDAQGVTQFTGSFSAGSLGTATTRNVELHLRATAATPTVGGVISFDTIQSYDPDQSFTLEATGLPANATLTLTVNGEVAVPVQTGPTGNLYVKEYGSIFFGSPEPTETVNLLPDAVDLSTAKTFTLSDAQGGVLASAGE